MKDNKFESNDLKRIDREAAEWVAKLTGNLSAKEQDAFFDWLAEDPRHGEWYYRHQKTWKQLDLLSLWMPEHSDKPSQDLLKNNYPGSRWRWLSAIAAILIAGFILVTSTSEFDKPPANLVADTYESHELPDGSVVELNQGAALKLNYTKEFRNVELVSNEAHFTVAKDPDRPFIVRVRGVDIRAVGTAFNVKLTDQSVQVIVTEGKVQVAAPLNENSYETPISDYRLSSSQELVVGQMTEVQIKTNHSALQENSAPAVRNVSLTEMNHYLAWKPQMFEFDSTPLSEVVEEFNRRNQTHLVIEDVQLAGMPIVASFRSANVDHFVELLQLSMDLEVEREGEGIIILRSSDSN